MSALWVVLMLLLLGACWLAGRTRLQVLLERRLPMSQETAGKMALLATIGIWSVWRGVVLLLSHRQPWVFLTIASLEMVTLAMVGMLYRSRSL